MTTTVFDDGSTLTWNDDYSQVSATDAPYYNVNVPAGNWAPSSFNPNAQSWDDVFKYGLARVIDARTQTAKMSNTLPLYQQQQALAQQQSSMLFWLILAGAALYALS